MSSENLITRRELLRRAAALVAAAGGSAVLSACVPVAPAPQQAPAAAATEVPAAAPAMEQITLNFLDVTINEELTQCANDALAAFTEETGISVETDKTPYPDFQTKVPTLLASGNHPDLYWAQPVQNAEFVPKNWLTPLDDYLAASTVNQKSDFIDAAWTFVTFEDRVYEMPKDWSARGGYYNKDILEQTGLTLPETVEELKQACLNIHEADPNLFGYMWPMKTADTWMWEGLAYIMLANGESILSPDGSRCTWNTEGMEETMAFFVDIWNAGAAPEQGMVSTNQDMYPVFGDGKVAFMHTGFWVIKALLPEIGPDNWDTFVVKGRTGHYGTPMSISGFAIPSEASHKDEAWQLAEWITLPEFVACFTTNPSARKANSPENTTRFEDPAYEPFFVAAEAGGIWPIPPNPKFGDVNQAVLDYSQTIILGQMSIKEGLAEACQVIDDLLSA